TFFPVLQGAIGFGSAFEGWTAHEEEEVPCARHTFHLEWDTDEQRPGGNFHICMELECSCLREQPSVNLLCLLHHCPHVQPPGHPVHQLLPRCEENCPLVLCTGEINLVAFVPVTQLAFSAAALQMLLKTQADQRRRKLLARCLGHLCEQLALRGPHPKHNTYALRGRDQVLQVHGQAGPQDSSHLKYLQLFAGVPVHKDFSVYYIKTIVMLLLSTVPVPRWHRRYFMLQLSDSLELLWLSLKRNTWRILLWATSGFWRRSACP
ncbi:hypothetical protein IHE44_0001268, partial [Lamprotornis superbus]